MTAAGMIRPNLKLRTKPLTGHSQRRQSVYRRTHSRNPGQQARRYAGEHRHYYGESEEELT